MEFITFICTPLQHYSVVDAICTPLQYSFMVKAIIVATVVGTTCAILSCFMILKGWSLLGDAISHAVLPGVVIAYIIGIPFSIGAFVFALLSVGIIGFVKTQTKIKEDAAMGIVFTTLFALGLILISRTPSSVDLMHILFGYVLGISDEAAIYTTVTLGFVAITILIFRRTLLAFTFDPIHTQSLGISVKYIHYALLTLLALTITASLQTVGVILVIAMLITPGSTALLLTQNFSKMLMLAVVSSVMSAVGGAYISYYLDISTGGAIVFLQGMIFAAVFLYTVINEKRLQSSVAE
ncbi:MAG: manganese transport system permease protein [Candidatus Azotimanducaceae bacterium]|jgi:manganese transport system permease protein